MATSTAYPQASNMQGIGTGGIMGINSPLPGLINNVSFDNSIINPLDIAPAVQPSEGDALVREIQMKMSQKDIKSPAFNAYAADVMKTKGFPTKTLQEYGNKVDLKLMPLPGMGGIMPFPDPGIKSLPGFDTKIGGPEMPDYTEKFSGYDTKIGGFDNQFKDIMTRLDKLEQGIGAMAPTPTAPSSPVQGGVPDVYTGTNARGY